MEKIVILLFLIVWIFNDQLILQILLKLPHKRLNKANHILRKSDTLDLIKIQYRKLRAARYLTLLGLFTDRPWILIGFIVLALIAITLQPSYQRQIQANQKVSRIRYQFPIYLRQIQILLQNNTLVRSVESSLESVPSEMKQDIEEFCRQIKQEPNQYEHYANCMNHYPIPELSRSMKWLYRYQTMGYRDEGHQFNRMIQTSSKWLRQERQESKKNKLMKYEWLAMIPLFSVSIVFLFAMMQVALSLFERR